MSSLRSAVSRSTHQPISAGIKVNTSPLITNRSFTLEGWLWYSGYGVVTLIRSGAGISRDDQYLLHIYDGQLEFLIKNNSVCKIHLGRKQQWIHLAVTRNNENKVTIFLNGNPLVSNANALVFDTTARPLLLGANHDLSAAYLISEIRIWNELRSPAQIRGAMKKQLNPPRGTEKGLIGYWRLDEGQGRAPQAYLDRGETGAFFGNTIAWVKFNFLKVITEEVYSPNTAMQFDIIRLTSNAVSTLSHQLFAGGMKNLLSLKSQRTIEIPALVNSQHPDITEIGYDGKWVRSAPASRHLGFNDAVGAYYWEIFFHAPFMLAGSLEYRATF